LYLSPPPRHPPRSHPPPHLHSFPTRRSSDLDELGLTGTKFGCGMALCGACTVHLDGTATRSCVTPISAAEGKKVTTIEGIGAEIDRKSTRLNSSHVSISYAVFCLKKKKRN